MKRLMIAAALTAMTPTLYSAPVFQPYGPNLSHGDVSNGQTALADINNPAAPAEKLESSGESWSMGLFPHFGVGTEFGDVDNLYDELDETANTIQNKIESFDINDSQQSAMEINSAISDANRILQLVEDGGYGKAITSLQVPLTPVMISGIFGGKLFFDANGHVTGRIGALTENIDFNPDLVTQFFNDLSSGSSDSVTIGDVNIVYNNGGTPSTADDTLSYDIANESTAVLKGAAVAEIGLGYSGKILTAGGGKLYGGLKGKYYYVKLVRDIERLSNLEEDSENYFENFDFDNAKTSSGYGLDAGMLWAADRYRLGATVTNLNEPSFKYNSIDLSNYENQRIADALAAGETYTMKRQLKLEGSVYFLDSKNIALSASYDANAVEDPTGDEYQWANAGVAYITDSWIIPGVRLGYRQNMAGSELSYIEGGLTWLYINLDGGMALEEVMVEGESYPRAAYVNLGLEVTF